MKFKALHISFQTRTHTQNQRKKSNDLLYSRKCCLLVSPAFTDQVSKSWSFCFKALSRLDKHLLKRSKTYLALELLLESPGQH